LQLPQSAMTAFEVAAKLDPSHQERHEILVEMYEASDDFRTKAIKERFLLIKENPFDGENYRVLRKHYTDARQRDKAWCVTAALVLLGKADAAEQRFFSRYRSHDVEEPKHCFQEETWRHVRSDDEDRTISVIMSAIFQQIVTRQAATPQ